jgi:hypothetical protein
MGWFDAWFDPDYVPDGNPRALMRMAVKAKTTLQRRRAIYGLAHVPCSDDMFALLNSLLDDKAVADAAAYALGYNADPRCKETAERIARSGGPLAKEAARGIGFDVRPPAELLQVALTHEVKSAVVEALSGLRAWGTPEALAALETFRRGTARPLIARSGDMEDGDGTWEECESSLFLGQQPSPQQIERTRRKLSALDPIRCAPRDEALARLRQSFDAPDSSFVTPGIVVLDRVRFPYPAGGAVPAALCVGRRGHARKQMARGVRGRSTGAAVGNAGAVGKRTGRCAEGASARHCQRTRRRVGT